MCCNLLLLLLNRWCWCCNHLCFSTNSGFNEINIYRRNEANEEPSIAAIILCNPPPFWRRRQRCLCICRSLSRASQRQFDWKLFIIFRWIHWLREEIRWSVLCVIGWVEQSNNSTLRWHNENIIPLIIPYQYNYGRQFHLRQLQATDIINSNNYSNTSTTTTSQKWVHNRNRVYSCACCSSYMSLLLSEHLTKLNAGGLMRLKHTVRDDVNHSFFHTNSAIRQTSGHNISTTTTTHFSRFVAKYVLYTNWHSDHNSILAVTNWLLYFFTVPYAFFVCILLLRRRVPSFVDNKKWKLRISSSLLATYSFFYYFLLWLLLLYSQCIWHEPSRTQRNRFPAMYGALMYVPQPIYQKKVKLNGKQRLTERNTFFSHRQNQFLRIWCLRRMRMSMCVMNFALHANELCLPFKSLNVNSLEYVTHHSTHIDHDDFVFSLWGSTLSSVLLLMLCGKQPPNLFSKLPTKFGAVLL